MKRALVVALLLTTACGGIGGPVEIPPEDIPFSLLRGSPSPGAEERTDVVRVYLVQRGRLVALERSVPADQPREEAAIRALLDGSTSRDRRQGITSLIPPATRLLELVVVDTIAEVDFSSEFQDPAPSNDIVLRVAQVVWTLVRLPSITAVRFAIDGTTIAVVTERGAVVQRPVTAPDYAAVGPAS